MTADQEEVERLRRWLSGRSPAVFMATGSRTWKSPLLVWRALEVVPSGWFMFHGGAKGLDTIAAAWWRQVHGADALRCFEPNWAELGRRAGQIRNRLMVDHLPEPVLAFRSPGVSPGTDGCVAYAEERGLEVFRFGAFPRSA